MSGDGGEYVANLRALAQSVPRLEAVNADLRQELAEARAEKEKLRDSLNWLVHLCHGCSKGGDEYSPPSDSEWKTCLKEAEELLDD